VCALDYLVQSEVDYRMVTRLDGLQVTGLVGELRVPFKTAHDKTQMEENFVRS
jgi:hypothetical protein